MLEQFHEVAKLRSPSDEFEQAGGYALLADPPSFDPSKLSAEEYEGWMRNQESTRQQMLERRLKDPVLESSDSTSEISIDTQLIENSRVTKGMYHSDDGGKTWKLNESTSTSAVNWQLPDEFSFSTELVDNPPRSITASNDANKKSSFDGWKLLGTALQITNQVVQTYQEIQAQDAIRRQVAQQAAAQQAAIRQQAAQQTQQTKQQNAKEGLQPSPSATQNQQSGASSSLNPDFVESQRRCGLASDFEAQCLKRSIALRDLDQAQCAGSGTDCSYYQSEAARQSILAWREAATYTTACGRYADGRYVWIQGPGLGTAALWPLPPGFPH